MIVERRIHSGCGQIAGVGRGQEGLDVVLIIVGQMTASGTEEVTVGMRRARRKRRLVVRVRRVIV